MQSPILATIELSVRLSVRLSVCLSQAGTVSKRRKLGSRNLHRRIAQVLKCSGLKVYPEIRKGSLQATALNESGIRKNSQFSAVSQKWCKIGRKLLLMINRKLYTPFRLVPKPTTLDDTEWPIRTLLQKRCVFRSPPQKF